MKIAITYPPLKTEKGVALLSQNRQFQYFKVPTYIYPVVPASAATLLSVHHFDVIWKDGIAEGMSEQDFWEFLGQERPDVVVIETKTPVIEQHWCIINHIKNDFPATIVILVGDHVTALPEESFQHSHVDFVVTGGDYDFLLLNLCKQLRTKPSAVQAAALEPGIYYRDGEIIRNTGRFQLNHHLDRLPFIDRELTQWNRYAYKNGNYLRTPGAYIMSGRDCWWGKCTFCSWPTLYPSFRSRSVSHVLDEIGYLVDTFHIKEIMDDTGSFPIGDWLRAFCDGMITRGYQRSVSLDCNMRFGALCLEEYVLMKQAGFRLVLFGIESANQHTLDRINKNLTVKQIIESCKLARQAGLYPHITIMFGYPWETYEDACKTLELGRWLLKKGYAHTIQATIVIPYPGTKLFDYCKEHNLLISERWEDFDMKKPIMKIPFSRGQLTKLVQGIYRVAYHPEFVIRRLLTIRSVDDVLYFIRGAYKVLGHVLDFNDQCNLKEV